MFNKRNYSHRDKSPGRVPLSIGSVLNKIQDVANHYLVEKEKVAIYIIQESDCSTKIEDLKKTSDILFKNSRY